MTTRGHVAGSQRTTIENLREANAGLCRETQAWQDRCLALRDANAGLCRETQAWQDRCLAMQTERDEAKAMLDALRTEAGRAAFALSIGWPLPEEVGVLRSEAALAEIEAATRDVPEQNCMIANRIARLALAEKAALAPEVKP